MSTLITKAEYIAFGHTAKEAVWIQRFINELCLNVATVESVTLHGNNKMSIALTNNVESQYQTKHIDVQHYHIRELVTEKELTIK